jgi:molybdopterin-containing oxidoreductase family iron-sulfur binding subunit
LGNYGKTVDVDQPSRQRQGNDAKVAQLLEDLQAGNVLALFVAGTDFTYNLPGRDEVAKAIANVPLVVSFAERVDDFASLAHFVCPDHHPLESWIDTEPVSGLVSLSQPTLQPLGQTRSVLESLHRWMGEPKSAYEAIKSHWQNDVLTRAKKSAPFQVFWDQAVHDGFVEVNSEPTETSEFQISNVSIPDDIASPSDFALSLCSKVGLTDSRHAHNPWLQELPDPVTKVTWDNYVSMSQITADKQGIVDGDVVRLATASGISIELPAHIQRGQHDRVLSVALGYGVRGTDRFAKIGPQWLESRLTVGRDELVGKNVSQFIEFRDGTMQLERNNVTLEKVAGRRDLASTQRHHSLEIPRNVAPHGAEVRDIVQETTLAAFLKDPRAGTPEVHHHGDNQLWAEDHLKPGHRWGMVVDQNCCTGCSACLIACQSENNVPVVGKDEVRRQREMHWIRIDRYYSGEDDDMQTAHQPMMCQHCGNAPCETVCPVLATVHSEEGLNEQAYNRCVGTRYCANNCPYKVRRFNWFNYGHEDDLQNLALNPDVTVRSRGVMEKCSMCVQRIEDGKLEAKRLGLPVEDGAIQTACQQSCPAQAIIFGDMNDPNSRVHAAMENPRRYGVLEEFNFRPSVSYMRVVRNRDDKMAEQHSAEGGHHA